MRLGREVGSLSSAALSTLMSRQASASYRLGSHAIAGTMARRLDFGECAIALTTVKEVQGSMGQTSRSDNNHWVARDKKGLLGPQSWQGGL